MERELCLHVFCFLVCKFVCKDFHVLNFCHYNSFQTGGDGCICYLEYDPDQRCLEFIGMKQVKELSLVQSVSADNNCLDDLANCGYAIGFASTDFIIWNLISEAKVVSLSQVFIPSCVHD